MSDSQPKYLHTSAGRKIAYHQSTGISPGVIFLGGFMSDMSGTKAKYLEQWAQQRQRAFIRFDYSGHGQSSERFEDGTIGTWLSDAQSVLSQLTSGQQVLVGSSMGGWMSLLLAKANPNRIAALVTLACATDFTAKLLRPALSDVQMESLTTTGSITIASAYDEEPYTITRNLIEEGDRHLLLDQPITIQCPVRMLHGLEDCDVPWQCSLETVNQLDSQNVVLELIKGGDHRLSSPEHLSAITASLDQLLSTLE